jgi:hypothetical protein
MQATFFLRSLSFHPLFWLVYGLTGWVDEREKGKFQDLHRSINICLRGLTDATPRDMNGYVGSLSMQACGEVLKSVESYLYSFRADLGVVSADIETLQNRSTHLNKRLENRKVGAYLPPDDIRSKKLILRCWSKGR